MPDAPKRDQAREFPSQQDLVRSPKSDPSALLRLLDGWMQDDEREQQETFEILRRSLDEDRPVGYKLFS